MSEMGAVLYFVIVACFWALWVVLCILIAKKKKRNVGIAALLGFIFGVLAVIAYAIAPSAKPKRKRVVSNHGNSRPI